jgi:hypothetical protein
MFDFWSVFENMIEKWKKNALEESIDDSDYIDTDDYIDERDNFNYSLSSQLIKS